MLKLELSTKGNFKAVFLSTPMLFEYPLGQALQMGGSKVWAQILIPKQHFQKCPRAPKSFLRVSGVRGSKGHNTNLKYKRSTLTAQKVKIPYKFLTQFGLIICLISSYVPGLKSFTSWNGSFCDSHIHSGHDSTLEFP